MWEMVINFENATGARQLSQLLGRFSMTNNTFSVSTHVTPTGHTKILANTIYSSYPLFPVSSALALSYTPPSPPPSLRQSPSFWPFPSCLLVPAPLPPLHHCSHPLVSVYPQSANSRSQVQCSDSPWVAPRSQKPCPLSSSPVH